MNTILSILVLGLLATPKPANSQGVDSITTANVRTAHLRILRPDSTQRDSMQAPSLSPDSAALVEIRSPVPGIEVFADGEYVGTAPFTAFSRDGGEHVLMYVPPDSDRWPSSAVVETLTFRRGERLVRTLEFPSTLHLTSEPYGATVRRDGIELGMTPLDIRFTSTRNMITLEKPGFETQAVPLSGGEHWVHLLLHPREGVPADPQTLYLAGEQSKNSFPIIITTGATVITGAAAAILKIKADNRYDDYRRTGDSGALNDVRRLDVASGISLAASELCLAGLAYFLLSR